MRLPHADVNHAARTAGLYLPVTGVRTGTGRSGTARPLVVPDGVTGEMQPAQPFGTARVYDQLVRAAL